MTLGDEGETAYHSKVVSTAYVGCNIAFSLLAGCPDGLGLLNYSRRLGGLASVRISQPLFNVLRFLLC